jgi:2-dehydropantoate 2-reductase
VLKDSPRIGIVGSGAVGAYYGARLQRCGHDVHFLMRSDLETVRSNGLVIKAHDGEFTLPEVNAYGSTEEMGPCDLVIIALKTTSNDQLIDLLKPLLHEETLILTLQNGLGSDELLAEAFGAERILGGLCFVCLNRTAPGVIENYFPGSISLGNYGRKPDTQCEKVVGFFTKAGVECRVVEDLQETRWHKLIWNVPFNGLSVAAGGITTDKILADLELSQKVRGLMDEVAAVAAKLGYTIKESFIEKNIENTRKMEAYKPSSLVDFLAGRKVEVESIWGEPLRQANAVGVETPLLEWLYQRLQKLSS